jgi:uncharacterized coiled-coil DUF342 family protein
MTDEREAILAELEAVRRERDKALAALREATDSIEYWAKYAGDYFRRKDGPELAALRAKIAEIEKKG